MNWISVKDRLPDSGSSVLTYDKEENHFYQCVFYGNSFLRDGLALYKQPKYWIYVKDIPKPEQVNELDQRQR